MNAILVRNSHTLRFDLCDPSPVPEVEFEATAIEVLGEMYPDCHVIHFKPTIQFNGEGWRPDLALVDKKFRFWFVLEVEVSTHSLQKHVLPQVTAFKRGDYTGVEDVLARSLEISLDRAKTLNRFVPRYVGVVSNHHDSHWQSALATENVQFVSIAAFHGISADKHALLVSGSFVAGERSVGFARVLASQQVMVTEGAFWREGEYQIVSDDGTNVWVCTLGDGKAWLAMKRGVIRFPENTYVQILVDGERLEIRPLWA